jgi:predicted nucleotidyltransferase component of viral defense system
MNTTIEDIIRRHDPKNSDETKFIVREILQSIILVALSRTNFFSKASFYGGTALRLFYGLNRFSEDLDFTLNKVDSSFSLEPYLKSISEVGLSYGLNLEVTAKAKQVNTPVESAFAKLNTYQMMIGLKIDKNLIKSFQKEEKLRVKLEIDTKPATGFKVESKWIDTPEFASINVLDESSLFAGKIHAVLCRNYKKTVKGRDYYDFLFFISQRMKPNLDYLRNKLLDSGKIKEDDEFNIDVVKGMLTERFDSVDFSQVRDDAQRFVFTSEDLSYYCKDLFIDCIKKI